ncbi:MAG: hypothetical protein ACRDNF_20700 [Streptosporangiaceae bacterium]
MSAQVLERTAQTTTARPGRLAQAWRRARQTVSEMNYAVRRLTELNATPGR